MQQVILFRLVGSVPHNVSEIDSNDQNMMPNQQKAKTEDQPKIL